MGLPSLLCGESESETERRPALGSDRGKSEGQEAYSAPAESGGVTEGRGHSRDPPLSYSEVQTRAPWNLRLHAEIHSRSDTRHALTAPMVNTCPYESLKCISEQKYMPSIHSL